MKLKFFADHCISNFIIQALRGAGCEVIRLKDVISPDSTDLSVIVKAQELDSVLVSLNGDFSDMVTYPPKNYKGIVALQVRNHPEITPQLITKLKHYLSVNPDMNHYKGKLFLVEAHRIRIRE